MPNVSGNYTVELINGICSNVSSVYNFTANGVNETTQGLVKIYPNPATNVIKIELLHPEQFSAISLTDVLGKEIINVDSPKAYLELNTEGLKPGVYFVNCKQNGNKTVYKVLIIK